MESKSKIATSAIAASVLALGVGVGVALPNNVNIEGSYEITQVNQYTSEISFDIPQEFTPDIVTLKLNDIEVSETLLPMGTIQTYPIVLSDMDRLTLDMYVRGVKAGEATFDDNGILQMKVEKEYVKDVEENTDESNEEN